MIFLNRERKKSVHVLVAVRRPLTTHTHMQMHRTHNTARNTQPTCRCIVHVLIVHAYAHSSVERAAPSIPSHPIPHPILSPRSQVSKLPHLQFLIQRVCIFFTRPSIEVRGDGSPNVIELREVTKA